ncbi:MAG: mechanosensitive ion channel domain-containing protein [Elusimicrobiota bacterium]
MIQRAASPLALLMCAALAVPAPAVVRAALPSQRGVINVPVAPTALAWPSTPRLISSSRLMGAASLAVPSAPLLAAPRAAAVFGQAASYARTSPATVLEHAREAFAAPSSPDAGPLAERSHWDYFWSGARASEKSELTSASSLAGQRPSTLAPARGRSRPASSFVPALGFASVGSAAKSLLVQYAPLIKAGGMLAATWLIVRAVHWAIGRFASTLGLNRQQVTVVRLVSSVVLWSAAAAAALSLGGVSAEIITAIFGAGGTLLSLALKDTLGNLIQGVNFLWNHPFSVGDRIQIDDSTGVVTDFTLTAVHVTRDGGGTVIIRYATLAAKAAVLLGGYTFPDSSLSLSKKTTPGPGSVVEALWKSFDRNFFIAGALAAALFLLPLVPGAGAFLGGWAVKIAVYAAAAAAAWLTSQTAGAAVRFIEFMADRYSWSPGKKVVWRLLARIGVWILGGGAMMRIIGFSWITLTTSLGLSTLGVGLATTNFFSNIIQGGEILLSKPFKIGDRLKVGVFDGVVKDMTLYHVVVDMGDGRHALLPYSLVRDAAPVVRAGSKTE